MFCDIYGNKCFEDSLDNVDIEKSCDCPIECTSISYSFTKVSTPFDEDEMCPSSRMGHGDFLMKPFYENKVPPKFVRKLWKIKYNSSKDDDMSYCKDTLKYRAEVIFRLATDSIYVTVLSKRLSSFDMLSSLGKYHRLDVIYLLLVLI